MGIHNWFGRKFEIGSRERECCWEEIWFIDLHSGQKFYQLTRDLTKFERIINDRCPRKEHFEGKLERQFNGRKGCFIEFCNELTSFVNAGVFPAMINFKRAVIELGIDQKIGRMYAYYYKKFFKKGRR